MWSWVRRRAAQDAAPEVSRQEVVAERSAVQQVFKRSDGLREVRLYSQPTFYERSPGDWAPIDTAVSRDANGQSVLESAGNSWSTQFVPLASSSGGVRLVGPSTSLEVVPLGASPVAPQSMDGEPNAVRYPGAWANTDLEYRVLPTGVKEDIVLHSSSAPSRFEFALRGGSARLSADGTVVVITPGGGGGG